MVFRHRTTLTGVAGAPWVSTRYSLGLGGQPEADALAAASREFWFNIASSVLNSSVRWTTESVVTEVDNVSGETTDAFAVAGDTGLGTSATEILPRAAQAILRLRTGIYLGGREIRGRLFVPGLTEGASTGGLVSTAAQNSIVVAWTSSVGEAENEYGAYTGVVWSRTKGSIGAIQSVAVWQEWGVLRSRRD